MVSTAVIKALALIKSWVSTRNCKDEEVDQAGKELENDCEAGGVIEKDGKCLPEGMRKWLNTLSRGMRGCVESPRYYVCAEEKVARSPSVER